MGFELRFTDKEITAWGGMGLMQRMRDHLGFDQALQESGLPQPGSNRGYRPEQPITPFMLSVWCGAHRFEPAKGPVMIWYSGASWALRGWRTSRR